MEQRKTAFVSDFDGTISDDDFFAYTTKTYFDEQALAPWRAFLAGQKTHFNALKEMFAQIHAPIGDFHALIETIRIDPDLEKTWQVCRKQDVALYICSAGNDYYIRRLIGNLLQKYNVTLVSNKGEYAPETGLVMTAPAEDYPYYDQDVGISKVKLVEKLKSERYFVVFAGDGPPDLAPAEKADIVFAKKFLLDACRLRGIKTQKFESFKDILTYFEGV
ncbi:MAG: MtnX-like HAD-IB family phosphatase [Alphaproteobacteria bacterium]|nr:MtnX-like HAD-IB family phosphatase [Alphaproteobacteria bacterium]